MKNTDISHKIKLIISNCFEISEKAITDDLEYQSIIEWDSFAHVSLMLALESEFNIIIDHSLVIKLISFEKINNYITQLNKKEISTQNTRELSGLHSIFISNEDILKQYKSHVVESKEEQKHLEKLKEEQEKIVERLGGIV